MKPVFVTDEAERAHVSRLVADPESGYTTEGVSWNTEVAEEAPEFDTPVGIFLSLVENRREPDAASYLSLSVKSGESRSTVIRRYDTGPDSPNMAARDEYNRIAPALSNLAFLCNSAFNNPESQPEQSETTGEVTGGEENVPLAENPDAIPDQPEPEREPEPEQSQPTLEPVADVFSGTPIVPESPQSLPESNVSE